MTVSGNFVYKMKKILGTTGFSDHFRKVKIRYQHIGYSSDAM